MHYQRERATGNPLRPCPTCGGDLLGSDPYCSLTCRPACKEAGCFAKCKSLGLCSTHYGDLIAFRRTGQPRKYRWATEKRCVVCGATEWDGKRRSVCSGACQQLLQRNGGQPPAMLKQCARCTTIIDLSVRHSSGRKTRADIKVCRDCYLAKYTRHRMSVTQLADRDGCQCGICGTEVDMTLVAPDLFRASVDHVLPYANGGDHDPTNLQLAHLWCNYVKSNRTGFVI